MNSPLRLKTLLGDYPGTQALRSGRIRSGVVEFDFADVKVPSSAFKRVVRTLEFDVAELAIMTYLIARTHGKPLVLLPAVLVGRFQHPYIVYNSARGTLTPDDLAGRRVGIRSYSVTTGAWLRGILARDCGLDLSKVTWVTFEEAHVAEFRDPPNVQRAPEGKELLAMLLEGELDAAIVGDRMPRDDRLKTLFPDPEAAAADWQRRNGALQINHMVVVKDSLSNTRPDVVREIYRVLLESKQATGIDGGTGVDNTPFGLEANRRNLEVAIDYACGQGLIRRRFEVDELFDDTTRILGGA